MPIPDITGGEYLIEILFAIGPVVGESALNEGDLEPWERRREIELQPWEAELIVQMSRSYMMERHESRSFSALAPWPKARGMWKYVQDELHKRSHKAEQEKEPPRNGNRKRR